MFKSLSVKFSIKSEREIIYKCQIFFVWNFVFWFCSVLFLNYTQIISESQIFESIKLSRIIKLWLCHEGRYMIAINMLYEDIYIRLDFRYLSLFTLHVLCNIPKLSHLQFSAMFGSLAFLNYTHTMPVSELTITV